MIIFLTLNKQVILQNLNRPKKLMVNLQTLNKHKMFILLTQKNHVLLAFNQCSKYKSFSTVQRLFYDVYTFSTMWRLSLVAFLRCRDFQCSVPCDVQRSLWCGDFRCKELLMGIELVSRQVSMIEALCFVRLATESQRPG